VEIVGYCSDRAGHSNHLLDAFVLVLVEGVGIFDREKRTHDFHADLAMWRY
jgi:hypothetical protein